MEWKVESESEVAKVQADGPRVGESATALFSPAPQAMEKLRSTATGMKSGKSIAPEKTS